MVLEPSVCRLFVSGCSCALKDNVSPISVGTGTQLVICSEMCFVISVYVHCTVLYLTVLYCTVVTVRPDPSSQRVPVRAYEMC